MLNPFYANVPFLYPLETSEDKRFSDVSGVIEMEHWREMGQCTLFPTRIWLFKFNNKTLSKVSMDVVQVLSHLKFKNTRKKCEICSKLTLNIFYTFF